LYSGKSSFNFINLPEMQNIKNQFDVGEIIKNHEPESIAEAIKF
jgi:hypothetical protein